MRLVFFFSAVLLLDFSSAQKLRAISQNTLGPPNHHMRILEVDGATGEVAQLAKVPISGATVGGSLMQTHGEYLYLQVEANASSSASYKLELDSGRVVASVPAPARSLVLDMALAASGELVLLYETMSTTASTLSTLDFASGSLNPRATAPILLWSVAASAADANGAYFAGTDLEGNSHWVALDTSTWKSSDSLSGPGSSLVTLLKHPSLGLVAITREKSSYRVSTVSPATGEMTKELGSFSLLDIVGTGGLFSKDGELLYLNGNDVQGQNVLITFEIAKNATKMTPLKLAASQQIVGLYF